MTTKILIIFLYGIGLFCFIGISYREALAQSQIASADLTGIVKDESNAVINTVTVSAKNPLTNFERVITTNEDGSYHFFALPVGNYILTFTHPGFASKTTSLQLTLGKTIVLETTLSLEEKQETIDINASGLDTVSAAVTQSIGGDRIDGLPINGRNFIGFAFINSLVSRDTTPAIGPAPTSGLSIGGQRARSNLVQVDGANYIDNVTKSVRATISQEAVQEFQVIINSFGPEIGRSSGGVVNIVTKSGTNQLHGNFFGFLRHRSIQARNGLAFQPPGTERPAFTRGQYGFTLGGPVIKNKLFYFLSLDQTQRRESGFSQIGLDPSIFQLSAAQQNFIANNPAGSLYQMFAISGIEVARRGIDPFTNQRVFLPTFLDTQGKFGNLPPGFRTLSNVQNVYPIQEEFTFYSTKLNYQVSPNNSLSTRYTFTPTTTTGFQTASQNQPVGLNDVSRTGTISSRDTAVVVQDTYILGKNKINEFIFNFGRRSMLFTSSPEVASNISGAGFFGREPFSPVNRTEKVFEIKDNFSYSVGNHNTKFGLAFNLIKLTNFRSELNFSGVFNFGDLAATAISPMFSGAPPFNAIQAYGLGRPQTFIQAFGDPTSGFTTPVIGGYGQDSWKIKSNLTLTYGVRYDIEYTPNYPAQAINTDGFKLSAAQIANAQRALGIFQGIPQDKNNIAPRIALAWDTFKNGKTVIRASYGIYYDNPLLFLASNADFADGVQAPQLIIPSGNPLTTNALNAAQIFQGTVVVGVTPRVEKGAVFLPLQQRFSSANAFPGYGVLLPFLLPVEDRFQYAYSNQVNFTLEQQLKKDFNISATYIFTGARKLPHSVNRNTPNGKRVLQATPLEQVVNNFFRPSGPNPVFVNTALPIPFGSVNIQESSSSSNYHALSLNLSKSFSSNLQFQASYSFSKSIDDSTDLQSLLQPQDNSNPGAERSLSNFDQRHRFVFSGIFKTPYTDDRAGLYKLLANLSFSPIIELSSGRPFNILTGTDTNLDQSSVTDRPNFDVVTGMLFLPNVARAETGSLGRNTGISPGFVSVDLKLSRTINLAEKLKLDLISEVFNLFNRVNVAGVNNNFRLVRFEKNRFRSSPTSLFEPRQFQFSIKLAF